MTEALRRLAECLPSLDVAARLAHLRQTVPGRIVFTTSFGLEDQYLTHVIFTAGLDIEVVTLDTGRLFPQTYALWAETESRYGKRIRAFYPDRDAVEELVNDQGIDGQFFGIEMRKSCCDVRKVVPLKRALSGASAWVTGLRGNQSQNRQGFEFASHDQGFGLLKVNPLLDWTRERLVEATRAGKVLVNPLHAEGFLSIGCAPCTRAVKPGEDERAGRWWWENEDAKECGLHVSGDGTVARRKIDESVSA